MEREIIRSLSNFEKVWERVSRAPAVGQSGPSAASEESDASLLRRFILDAAAAAESYKALAARTGGSASNKLRAMALEESRSLGRLQTERFLLAGDTLPLPKRKSGGDGVLSGLRSCYLSEDIMHRAYLAASRRTESEALKALYRENAALSAAHRETLRGIIGRAMM